MSMGKSIRKEITEWGILAMVIVILSVILLTMSNVDTVRCASNYAYNATEDLCCLTVADCAQNASVTGNVGTITDFVVAFSEPKNWVIIVIVGLIGIGLIGFFKRKNQ